MQTTFLIVDDHPMVRAGLIALLRSYFCHGIYHEADTLDQARAVLRDEVIDFALLDYQIGSEQVLSLIPDIAHYHPQVKMLVVSMMESREIGAACLRAGAHGFLQKAAHPDEVIRAIKQIQEGSVYGRHLLSPNLEKEGGESAVKRLSKRELEVFSLIGGGLKTGKIAEQLGVSVKTIEAHRQHIKEKLRIENASQLTIRAAKWLES